MQFPQNTAPKCRMHSCFDIYRCRFNENSLISVYVYPYSTFLNEKGRTLNLKPISVHFDEMLTAIKESSYYTDDKDKACIIIPPLDILNQNGMDLKATAQALAALETWKYSGQNHLIFNMLPGGPPDFNSILDVPLGKAIQAGGSMSTQTYRPGFDVSIPVFNALTVKHRAAPRNRQSKWQVISTQVNIHEEFRKSVDKLASKSHEYLVLGLCPKPHTVSKRCRGKKMYDYPHIMQRATFCLVIRGARLGQTALLDSLMMGCIPIVVSDDYILPFSEVLDWKRAAVVVSENEIDRIPLILKDYSQNQIKDMRLQGKFMWENYFSSMGKIALTTLRVINDRVYKHHACMYEDWNAPYLTSKGDTSSSVGPSLFLPLIPPRSQGFTAVVLSYDRVDMMFKVLRKIADTPSLAKIVVVWNNVKKAPPSVSKWPKLPKPVKVIQAKRNRLSNRFYPYSEIETEAILAIDDDILMLSTDELEFGFEAWREFPDRLVGFPGRIHLYDNASKLKYDSEWTNDVSMVLTGVAFHHKYFSHLFTYMMPYHVRSWVDSHMNCEDIAMNFMIANY
ncbi:predicted protein, partial [Nematostella vectensis]